MRQAGIGCLALLALTPLFTIVALWTQPHGSVLLGVAAFHWLLLGECWWRHRQSGAGSVWPQLFQRLQLTGPLLMAGVVFVLSP